MVIQLEYAEHWLSEVVPNFRPGNVPIHDRLKEAVIAGQTNYRPSHWAMTVERTVAAWTAPGEIDYGYKYTIHNRLVGQSLHNCSAVNISNIATILFYKTFEIA